MKQVNNVENRIIEDSDLAVLPLFYRRIKRNKIVARKKIEVITYKNSQFLSSSFYKEISGINDLRQYYCE